MVKYMNIFSAMFAFTMLTALMYFLWNYEMELLSYLPTEPYLIGGAAFVSIVIFCYVWVIPRIAIGDDNDT